MALFDRAASYCTVGSTAPALARLHSDVAFPLMIERLPSDRNMFSMNLPEALALYGKPEAIAPLGRALQDALKDDARNGRSVEAIMGGMGTGMFIDRCLWALATFKTPEARKILEAAAVQPSCDVEATAALFVQSRDAAHFRALLKLLKKHPGKAEWIAKRFHNADLAEASAVEEIARADAAAKEASDAKRKK
jgi:hypothetical protein